MIQRKRPRKPNPILSRLPFLFLIFLAAVSGTFVALQLFGGNSDANRASAIPEIVTVEIIITATPNPSRQQIVVTATSQPGQVELPNDFADSGNAAATIDAAQLDAVALGRRTQNTAADDSQNDCIFHSVVSGETVGALANRYGVDLALMLEVNDLTLDTAPSLQIGDTLLVPLESCAVESPSAAPSTSLDSETAPAENARIEIIEIEGLDDITAEGVRLRNMGAARLNLRGWTLTDDDGSSFAFPERLLFPDFEITLYTRSGADSGEALFWGRDRPVWQAGDVLTLTDAAGQIQATMRVAEAIALE